MVIEWINEHRKEVLTSKILLTITYQCKSFYLFIYLLIYLSYFSIYLFFTDDSVSWVSAENLWILGRYMVHLSFEEITKISPVEVSWKSTFTCPHHQAIWGKVYSKPVMFSQLVQVPWKIGCPPQPIYLEPLKKTLMWLVVRLCLV